MDFVFVKSAKGADARRQTTKKLAGAPGGAPSAQPMTDTASPAASAVRALWVIGGVVRGGMQVATVLRVFLRRVDRNQILESNAG